MKRTTVMDVFELISGVKLTSATNSELTIELVTTTYKTDENGTVVPDKFKVVVNGKPSSKKEEKIYEKFMQIKRMSNMSKLFGLRRNARHDIIIWFVEAFYSNLNIEIKFKAIPVRGDKCAYTRIENAFGLNSNSEVVVNDGRE